MAVWSIIAVELTLNWNSVVDVYEVRSTGQLIPLVGGLMLVISIAWQSIEKVVSDERIRTLR